MIRRASQPPKTNQPHRRLNSFRRQLVAAFSSEHQPRSSSSLESDGALNYVVEESDGSLCEQELEDGLKITRGNLNLSRSEWTRARGRNSSSPKHLIRMFAERHDDPTNETAQDDQQRQTGAKNNNSNLNFMSLIVETPIRAANCFKIDRFTKAHSSDVNHVARSIRSSDEILRQAEDVATTRIFNPPPRSPNSIQLPPGSGVSLCRNDKAASRSASQAASAKTVLKKQAPLSSEARKLVELLGSHEWRLASDQTVNLAKNSLSQLRLELKRKQGGGISLPDESLRLQHEALCELIDTELYYMHRLKLIVDLFLGTLAHVQARLGLLTDITKYQVASNVDQILEANLRLWEKHLNMKELASNEQGLALTPMTFADAFANIHHKFKPYYRFCIEQSSCTRFVRKLALTNDCFRIYLAWCETQHECDRMRLTDLLACPMQRLTRYSLLLRTILRQTPSEELDQHECLLHMIALTDKFVKSVDLELRRRDEFLKLLRASDRVDLNQLGEDCGADSGQQQQILELLNRHYRRLDLMAPLFNCPSSCLRQLIFDSSIAEFDGKARAFPLVRLKFKDSQTSSKLDVVLLIFTDQLIICQHQRPDQMMNGNLLRRQSSNYLASFKRRSMRLSKRQPASSTTRMGGQSFDRSYSPPVTPNECCKSYHSDNNFLARAEGNSSNQMDMDLFAPEMANNLSWPIRRRAASHSYLVGTNLFTLAGSDCVFTKRSNKPVGSSLLSPARAILRVPSERTLNDGPQLYRHQSRSSQHISASVFNQYHGSSSSYENSSNCSLLSSKTNAACRHHPEASDDSASWRFISMRAYDLSAQSDNESAASTHKQARSERHQDSATSKLLAIRPPYATERLAMHELADGQSVLFCQLNDTRTIVNSFVVYCNTRAKQAERLLLSSRSPNQSTSSCPQNHSSSIQAEQLGGKTFAQSRRANPSDTSKHATGANYHDDAPALTQARRLILLVKEAQVRYRALAKLHGLALSGSVNGEPPRSCSLYQNSLSLEVPSSPKHPLGYTHFRSNDSELEDISSSDEQGWRLKLFSEQHQLFLLNHGLHHELVTHEFSYNERRPNDFVVSAKAINATSNRATSSSGKAAFSAAHGKSNQRPLLSRFNRSDSQLNDTRCSVKVDSPRKSICSDYNGLSSRGLLEGQSKSNSCLDHIGEAVALEKAAKEMSQSPPGSMGADAASSHMAEASNPPSPHRSGRRTLNSLRRQNVILSASCEHHQLVQTTHDERESASGRLLRIGGLESSSIDSLGVLSITDDSLARSGLRGIHQLRSSSIQTTTIDQTFDDDDRPSGPGAHHNELCPIKSLNESMSLQHQPSASSEQTSSPIAVTLTVPSRASFKEQPQLETRSVLTETDPQAGGSIIGETELDEERQTGCLDLNRTLCLISGGGGGSKRPESRKAEKLSPRKAHRSRSPAARLQDMIQCLRSSR